MGIDPPKRVTREAQTVALIHVFTPAKDMPSAMRSAMGEVSKALKDAGVSRNAPWFAHYHRPPTDTFDFDVCFPIDKPLDNPSGRVENGKIDALEVIRTVHRGPFEGLSLAWQEFNAWMKENNVDRHQDGFEVYVVGPDKTEDPAKWETYMEWTVVSK